MDVIYGEHIFGAESRSQRKGKPWTGSSLTIRELRPRLELSCTSVTEVIVVGHHAFLSNQSMDLSGWQSATERCKVSSACVRVSPACIRFYLH